MSTRDRESGPKGPWFDEIAAFLGPAYLRNAFTKGTEQEVDFLVARLGLEPGMRVLDVGCGPGRHALALARRGLVVHGVDRSVELVALARRAAASEELAHLTCEVLDVRDLAANRDYDAVICLCQGGFGLLGGEDEPAVFARLAAAVSPGGRLALTACSAAFALRWLEDGETYDPLHGVLHERTAVRAANGDEREFDLWTTCFTPRELMLLASREGLVDVQVHGARPGAYRVAPPTLHDPELLLLARRPRSG